MIFKDENLLENMKEEYKKLSETEKNKIIKKISSIIRRKKNILSAILFGSFVTRKYFRDIDIALALKGRMNIENLAREIEIAIRNVAEVDIKVFSELPLKLQFFVLKYGKAIYIADQAKWLEIKRYTLSRFLDFKPVIDFHTKRLLYG